MTSEDLRKLAAGESAYVASRLVTYKEDGATPPEAIRRLGVLADAVLAFTPSLASSADSGGIDYKAIAAEMIRSAKDAQSSLAIARQALYGLSASIDDVNARLDGSSVPVAASAAVGSTVEDSAPRQPAQRADLSHDTIATWPASGLRHGLILVRGESDRRIFSEPIKGQYSVQTMAFDGLTAGEPWSTVPDAWTKPDDEWREEMRPIPMVAKPRLPRYDDAPAKPAKAKAEPKPKAEDRTIPMFEAPPPRKTVADFAPDDAQFQTWLLAINGALEKAAKEPVEETKIRAVFADWKATNAAEEKANPAAAFWHHAKAAIVG